jgi:hypothetical protein
LLFPFRLSNSLQDIPNIIAAAREQRSERLAVQASMRDTANPDTHVVLYLQASRLLPTPIVACCCCCVLWLSLSLRALGSEQLPSSVKVICTSPVKR